jgi:hypothetical protein
MSKFVTEDQVEEIVRRIREKEDGIPVSSPTATPQPPPSPGKSRIVDLVMADLAQRAETGRIKYGTYLYSHNGRNALIDAYQEALDLCMYLRQAIEENPPA